MLARWVIRTGVLGVLSLHVQFAVAQIDANAAATAIDHAVVDQAAETPVQPTLDASASG